MTGRGDASPSKKNAASGRLWERYRYPYVEFGDLGENVSSVEFKIKAPKAGERDDEY